MPRKLLTLVAVRFTPLGLLLLSAAGQLEVCGQGEDRWVRMRCALTPHCTYGGLTLFRAYEMDWPDAQVAEWHCSTGKQAPDDHAIKWDTWEPEVPREPAPDTAAASASAMHD